MRLATMLLALAMAAQQPSAKSASPEAALLLERANLLTSEIQEGASKLDPEQQMILPSRLAEVWAKADAKRAAAWRQEALAAVETTPPQETDEQRRRRINAAAAMLESAATTDPAAANRLVNSMIDSIRNIDPDTAPRADADLIPAVAVSIMNAEIQIAHDEPDRALSMLEKIVLLPNSNVSALLMQGYIDLKQSSDPSAADRLLRDAIAQAQSAPTPTLLGELTDVAMPQPGQVADLQPPAATRQQISDLLGQWMLQPPQSQPEREQRCRFAATATTLLPQMTPELQGQVQAAVQTCKDAGLVSKAATRNQELSNKTSDEMLQAAQAETDLRQRAMEKVSAATRLDPTDPLRALALIDNLSPEEKHAYPQWRVRRKVMAQNAVNRDLRQHDLKTARQIIDASPDADKPELLLTLSLAAVREKDDTLAFSTLREARDLMQHVDLDNNWRPWLILLGRYAQLVPAEAPLVAREAMTGLNNIKTYTDDELRQQGKVHVQPFAKGLPVINLNPAWAHMDPQAIEAAINLLESPANRTVMRLGVLRLVLDNYEKAVSLPKKQAAKTAR